MQEILWLLKNNLDFEQAKKLPQTVRVPFLDMGYFSPKVLDKMDSPRVFKSHFTIPFLPDNFNKIAKVRNIILLEYYLFLPDFIIS